MVTRKRSKSKKKTTRKPKKTTVVSSNHPESGAGSDHNLPSADSMRSLLSWVVESSFFLAGDDEDCIEPDAIRLSRLKEAQNIVYDAWDAMCMYERIFLAKKALDISDLCADAWVILAEESGDLAERIDFLKHGVVAGKNAIELDLGSDAFTEHAGFFWGILETRPYMRALEGLSQCIWRAGEREKSLALVRHMLELNPNDNQGMRFFLVSKLFALDDLSEAEKLLKFHEEPYCSEWCWNMALLLFRKEGASSRANKAINKALEENPFVPKFLTQLPEDLPARYTPSSPEEAIVYASHNAENWSNTKGALSWAEKKAKGVSLSKVNLGKKS